MLVSDCTVIGQVGALPVHAHTPAWLVDDAVDAYVDWREECATVRDAYVALTSTTIVLFFIPYLYLFGAYLRLRRRRTRGSGVVGWVGFAAVVLSIALSLVPPAVSHPLVFEVKVIGGTLVFLAIGVALTARGVRSRTASSAPGA